MGARKTGNGKREPLQADPNDCAILAVDPGETSGWAIWDRGSLVSSGTCPVWDDDPAIVISHLLSRDAPHVGVVERPFLVRYGTQTGIGTADRIWRHRLAEHGLARRTVRVYPATWRSRTLVAGWARAGRNDVRTMEQIEAARILGAAQGPPGVHPDIAAAICIGRWATFASEVKDKLPKRKAKKT